MRAWTSPDVPSLDSSGWGEGSPVRVHDSASGSRVTVDPDSHARLYVCGITPYDATHLGHAATYLAFDLLQRAWRDRGLDVTYTQNVTDVDDPLLERATATGVDWVTLAEAQTELFRQDMTALRIISPDHYVGAVESIDLVVDLVDRLTGAGATYRVDDDLYFDVHADAGFGSVSGLDEAAMRAVFAERGGDPDRPGKRHPLDCLLWQAERPGEPAWDTRLGRGRPGWHIECAAIALEHLGTTFDVQGGGSDLLFPHHEMSASEAAVATGLPFAGAFVHTGMVGYQGEKMSKSKGNLVLVSRLRADGHDPMAIRLALLAHHYRTDWEWHDDEIVVAEQRLGAWRSAVHRTVAPAGDALLAEVRAALSDDLDAPRALAAVDAWAADDSPGAASADPQAGRTVRTAVDVLLGVSL
ncbi:cysteine--1-D-myo-inosityl 2-amino-2-deoxy-alpha-D-glucopyranoside ligase [Aeromicrobium marinum DSM 15272]|uniref:L-cysteine:1D-myo-inositol 2-amino-2-deoxy-alpha-D-glucopyranoside ligase n=1 Tax=Aeromicrobium marinum DSM 15272 TaxID=585531 RepID=E2S9X5_9ACTN|nr:cysteine--1-D-myo-inosityl 2-amino-2-deoxy-alpha-D-glucopyranoside ligase [Aeromicrobium marinum]EFQ84049.1 cysteine--1-D-myo-inosityl 2-amino-2-deoxy-alpha-D-glucopyranoside ligase [Aeromicrobium marinum DSM 15272]